MAFMLNKLQYTVKIQKNYSLSITLAVAAGYFVSNRLYKAVEEASNGWNFKDGYL